MENLVKFSPYDRTLRMCLPACLCDTQTGALAGGSAGMIAGFNWVGHHESQGKKQ